MRAQLRLRSSALLASGFTSFGVDRHVGVFILVELCFKWVT